MGTKYLFRCSECGYQAIVSDGEDRGFFSVVRTMECLDCRELVDVLIGAYGEKGKKTGNSDLDKLYEICPKCKCSRVSIWDKSKPCPKCREKMRQDPDFGCDWD